MCIFYIQIKNTKHYIACGLIKDIRYIITLYNVTIVSHGLTRDNAVSRVLFIAGNK